MTIRPAPICSDNRSNASTVGRGGHDVVQIAKRRPSPRGDRLRASPSPRLVHRCRPRSRRGPGVPRRDRCLRMRRPRAWQHRRRRNRSAPSDRSRYACSGTKSTGPPAFLQDFSACLGVGRIGLEPEIGLASQDRQVVMSASRRGCSLRVDRHPRPCAPRFPPSRQWRSNNARQSSARWRAVRHQLLIAVVFEAGSPDAGGCAGPDIRLIDDSDAQQLRTLPARQRHRDGCRAFGAWRTFETNKNSFDHCDRAAMYLNPIASVSLHRARRLRYARQLHLKMQAPLQNARRRRMRAFLRGVHDSDHRLTDNLAESPGNTPRSSSARSLLCV